MGALKVCNTDITENCQQLAKEIGADYTVRLTTVGAEILAQHIKKK